MPFARMRGCGVTTFTRLSTMLRSTSMALFTRMAWRTSGACSSVPSTAPMSASSRSTCSGIWTSRLSALTTGGMTDSGRFLAVAASVVGKRLTYVQLTGKGSLA